LKDWIREFEDAGRYVSVMRALHGKRLLRAFGCLYGRRKSTSGKPSGGGISLVGERSEATRTRTLAKGSNKSSSLVCEVCSGIEFEWVDGPIVNGQLVVSRSGDG
jgi:hypothetical protein